MDTKLTDSSLMPTGKYAGHTMDKVPAKYLLFIYENNLCSKLVHDYIVDNLDIIKKQVND